MNSGGGGEPAGDGIQDVSRCSSSRCRMFSSSGNELRRVHVKQLQLQLQSLRVRAFALFLVRSPCRLLPSLLVDSRAPERRERATATGGATHDDPPRAWWRQPHRQVSQRWRPAHSRLRLSRAARSASRSSRAARFDQPQDELQPASAHRRVRSKVLYWPALARLVVRWGLPSAAVCRSALAGDLARVLFSERQKGAERADHRQQAREQRCDEQTTRSTTTVPHTADRTITAVSASARGCASLPPPLAVSSLVRSLAALASTDGGRPVLTCCRHTAYHRERSLLLPPTRD
jgi:hypothetical protein